MHNLFIAEFIKLKRKKVLILLPIALIAEIVIICSQVVSNSDFFDVYFQAVLPITIPIHTTIICLLGISFFYDEYKNKTITYIATTPISPTKYLFSKLTIMGVFSLCLNLITTLLFVIVSLSFYNGSSAQFLGSILVHQFINAFAFTLASIPLLLLTIIFKRNIFAFFMAAFAYVVIFLMHTTGMILIEGKFGIWLMDCIHPLGNAVSTNLQILYELTYRFASDPEIYGMPDPGVIWFTQITCLLIVSLLCICISVILLKRQKDI